MINFLKKILSIILAVFIAAILFFTFSWVTPLNKENKDIKFGANFSQYYAESLGLDWKETYLAMIDELGIKYLRLESEWNRIETQKGSYFFKDLDWQIAEAEKRNIEVMLVLGQRQPHWPECHIPDWAANKTKEEQNDLVLGYIKEVVLRYKNSPAIKIWQVENEPLFDIFGECPPGDRKFLKKEIELVKTLDNRPVLITDSGEISTWLRTAHLSDYLGISIYRVVYNPHIGYFYHFFSPFTYRFKANLIGLKKDEVVISELQAEPWKRSEISSLEELIKQKEIMGPERVRGHIDFAKRTGFSKAYIWGVEWWYWLKKHGDSSIWGIGEELWGGQF
jgi:hypothetical protein